MSKRNLKKLLSVRDIPTDEEFDRMPIEQKKIVIQNLINDTMKNFDLINRAMDQDLNLIDQKCIVCGTKDGIALKDTPVNFAYYCKNDMPVEPTQKTNTRTIDDVLGKKR